MVVERAERHSDNATAAVAKVSVRGSSTRFITVKSIEKGSSAAECQGLVPGLMLQEIEGRSVIGVSFAEVERRLKPRPIHLVFVKAQ